MALELNVIGLKALSQFLAAVPERQLVPPVQEKPQHSCPVDIKPDFLPRRLILIALE